MFLLAEDGLLGHVVDKHLIGGHDPLFSFSEGWHLFGSPILTMHMVTLMIATGILIWVLNLAAKAIATGPESQGNDRYLTSGRLGQLVEVITLYLRDTVIRPILGDHSNRYVPYLLTIFFFILMNNLLGLLPLLDLQHLVGLLVDREHGGHFAVLGSTATGNLAVTAGLALVAFFVIQAHGLRELGLKGWAHHLLGGAPWYLFWIMIPVEFMGLFIKPAALAIRLFANMMAGHMLLATLSIFGVMAYRGLDSWIAALGVSALSAVFAILITFLEVFIAFLQSFIFMILTTVFIAQLSHHGDHEDHAEHADETDATPALEASAT